MPISMTRTKYTVTWGGTFHPQGRELLQKSMITPILLLALASESEHPLHHWDICATGNGVSWGWLFSHPCVHEAFECPMEEFIRGGKVGMRMAWLLWGSLSVTFREWTKGSLQCSTGPWSQFHIMKERDLKALKPLQQAKTHMHTQTHTWAYTHTETHTYQSYTHHTHRYTYRCVKTHT